MKTITERKRRLDRWVRAGIASTAACSLLIASSTAHAQDAYEWESDEGTHEEEWYDPSDWFDDDFDYETSSTVDYETDDWGWDYDNDYDTDYLANDYEYDGYYDGYYDGFNDDDFGYDYWDEDWDADYSTAYTEGYYDGYYDADQEYEYEPYYYVTTNRMDQNRQSDRQRAQDQTRQRGDRVADIRRDRQARPQDSGFVRKRGTVQRISQANVSGLSDEHFVATIRMEDGDTVTANFGPNMTRQRLPFSQGDRVTLRGEKKSTNGQSLLVVQRITSGDREINLRGDNRNRQRFDRQRDRQRQDRMNQRMQRDRQQYDRQQRQREQMRADRQRQRDRFDRRGRDRFDQEYGYPDFEGRQWLDRPQDERRQQWQRDQQRQRGQQPMQRQRDRQQMQQRDQRSDATRFRGTIESVSKVQAQDTKHNLYRVELDNGQSHVIALDKRFDRENLQDLEGDSIRLHGKQIDLNGRQVIKAKRIRIDGERVRGQQSNTQRMRAQQNRDRQRFEQEFGYPEAERRSLLDEEVDELMDEQQRDRQRMQRQREQRQREQMQRDRQQPDRQQTQRDRQQRQREQAQKDKDQQKAGVQFRGTIESVTAIDTDVEGHNLYRVRLDNNQTYTIALNKRFDRDNLQGLQGQPIRFHGERASLNGRDVVKARKIRIDGERLRKQNQNRNQNQND